MSGTDCVDICDIVLEVMCHPCPNFKECQNKEDEANHAQMAICMGSLKMGEYPKTFTPIEDSDPVVRCALCGEPYPEGKVEYVERDGDKPRPYCVGEGTKNCLHIDEKE